MTHRSHISGRGTGASLQERRGWSLLLSAWVHAVVVIGVVRCPAAAPSRTTAQERLVSVELTQDLARLLAGANARPNDPTDEAVDPDDAPNPAPTANSRTLAAPLAPPVPLAAAAALAAVAPAELVETPPLPPPPLASPPDAPAPTPDETVAVVQPDVQADAPPPAATEPEPPPEVPELAEAQKYVRLSEQEDEEDAVVDPTVNVIAGRDSSAPITSRAAITAKEDGPQREEVIGSEAAKATPAKNVDPSDPAEKHGGQVLAKESRPAKTGGGGGLSGEGRADGAAGPAGETSAGGEAAPAGAAGRTGQPVVPPPAPATNRAGSGPITANGVPIAPVETPDWWQPMASFVGGAPSPQVPAAPAAPVAIPVVSTTPAPATREVVAKEERLEKKTETGGNEKKGEAAPRPGEVETEVEGPEVGPRVGAVDPVEDLRSALGWGGIDREKLKPRQSTVGYVGTEASTAASAQTVLDRDVELSNVVWVAAHASPLGKYFDVVYPLLQARWEQQDLDILDRGLGVQGEVSVVFRIRANGRVEQAAVLRSSGNSTLDQMALASVPEKLPKMPKEIGADSVLHKVTFRYDNPLVTAAGRP